MSGPLAGARALVTGATGFLGAGVVRALLERGCRVRALARETSSLHRLSGLDVEVVRGDLEDPPSLQGAATGQQLAVHAAARVSDWSPRAELERVNVRGTANLLRACQGAGVARLVHVSSLTVLGLPRDGRTVDEASACPVPRRGDHYSASKLESERLVRQAHGQGGLATTVVRSGVIWGPGDPNVLPRVAALLRQGALPYLSGGHNLLGLSHVANLSLGVALAAATPAAAGQLYHVTDGEEVTAREALQGIAAALGVAPPRLSLPVWLVLALAGASEAAARGLGRRTPPPLTRYGVRLVACHCRYDIGKAERELSYRRLVSFSQGVRELHLAGGS